MIDLTETIIYTERLIMNSYLVYLILFKSLIGAWPVLEVILVIANIVDFDVLYLIWPALQNSDYT